MTPDPWCTADRHGTRTAYNKRGCRCTATRAMAAAYERRRYAERKTGQTRLVDATGTRRRVQALNRAGWSDRALAPLLFMHRQNITKWRTQKLVSAKNAQLVADLYDQIGLDEGTNVRTQRAAERRGWPAPIEWGLDIDDPKAKPIRFDRSERNADWSDIELVVASGETWSTAAARLGTTEAALDRRLHRNGRRDLVARLTRQSEQYDGRGAARRSA